MTMLSSDQLSQLTQLKQDIRSSRDVNQGTIRGTSGRYGFVTLEDGRDAFLNPDQMERVFPGDIVEVEVTTSVKNGKEQYEAKLERLIESPIVYLSGRYRVRGKGHFIATDLANLSRWIFIPPKNRAGSEEGDYITAKILRHPFKDGRAQAKILNRIGSESTPFIERLYTVEKYQLDPNTPKPVAAQIEQLSERAITSDAYTGRTDLSHLPFVTIDAAATKDMDDALSIETTEQGWRLSVAIADPATDIDTNSPLDNYAKRRGQSVYLPGSPLPMLPTSLSVERYSLKQGVQRLALVFQCHVSSSGEVSEPSFQAAMICSQAKLSYTQVACVLEGKNFDTPEHLTDASEFIEQLTQLRKCSQALQAYRQQHHIVTHNKPDFALFLNDCGKLNNIEKIEKNIAHTIVEEAMLATNRAAGDFLAQHNTGIFTHHRGYRDERREDIEALLSEKLGTEINNTDQREQFMATVKTLQSDPQHQALLSIQQRFLEPSQLVNKPNAHFGLGFAHYATITSPIRRYQDLCNQRLIHQILSNTPPKNLPDQAVEKLQSTLSEGRDAVRSLEQWLIADYMKPHIGKTFSAQISLLTNQGVGVRLVDTGVEGFIVAKRPDKKDAEKTGDKVSFNNQRMELLWNGQEIFLDQVVEVSLTNIDESRNKLEFDWVETPALTAAQ